MSNIFVLKKKSKHLVVKLVLKPTLDGENRETKYLDFATIFLRSQIA